VRQIEVRAFEKVQNAVKNRIAEIETPHGVPVDDTVGRDVCIGPGQSIELKIAGSK
jgi:hypothetical protein